MDMVKLSEDSKCLGRPTSVKMIEKILELKIMMTAVKSMHWQKLRLILKICGQRKICESKLDCEIYLGEN